MGHISNFLDRLRVYHPVYSAKLSRTCSVVFSISRWLLSSRLWQAGNRLLLLKMLNDTSGCWSWGTLFDIKIVVRRAAFNKFPDFFVQAFKIVVDSWKVTMLLLYIVWDDWPILMISDSNEQLQQQLKYTLIKPDCHSWWISKMQSGREDTSEERYAIKLCFKLGKNARETYGMLQTAFGASCMNRTSVRTPVLGSHWTDSQQEILCWGFKRV